MAEAPGRALLAVTWGAQQRCSAHVERRTRV